MHVSIVSESAIEFRVIHVVMNKEIPNIINRHVSFLQYCRYFCIVWYVEFQCFYSKVISFAWIAVIGIVPS
jgi:hypothetical protein